MTLSDIPWAANAFNFFLLSGFADNNDPEVTILRGVWGRKWRKTVINTWVTYGIIVQCQWRCTRDPGCEKRKHLICMSRNRLMNDWFIIAHPRSRDTIIRASFVCICCCRNQACRFLFLYVLSAGMRQQILIINLIKPNNQITIRQSNSAFHESKIIWSQIIRLINPWETSLESAKNSASVWRSLGSSSIIGSSPANTQITTARINDLWSINALMSSLFRPMRIDGPSASKPACEAFPVIDSFTWIEESVCEC